jgi:hypothetical protein
MAKLVDKKNQERVTLDTLLSSMVEKGVIYAGTLKKGWKSIQPLLTRKRLEYFLRTHSVRLHGKCLEYISKFSKTLAKSVNPELIAA